MNYCKLLLQTITANCYAQDMAAHLSPQVIVSDLQQMFNICAQSEH